MDDIIRIEGTDESLVTEDPVDLQRAFHQFDYLRFSVVDIHGVTRSKTVCRSGFADSFRDGMDMKLTTIGMSFGGDLFGPARKLYSELHETRCRTHDNLMARPVPWSLHPLPACGEGKYRVGQVLCETFYPWNNENQLECPRYVARKQLGLLESMGFQLYSRFKVHFRLVDPRTSKPVFEQAAESQASLTFSKFESVLLDMCSILTSMGVDNTSTHVESSPGEFELILTPQVGIKAADNASLAKDCVKDVARKHGLTAAFLSKTYPGQSSTTSHLVHSLWSIPRSQNAFSDLADILSLSSVFRGWMGGLVRHFRAITAVCQPTNNCRHTFEDFDALYYWGIDDCDAPYRVNNDSPSGTCIENRLPTGSANYYLAIAATVAAGIDGISQQLPCPPPMNENMQELNAIEFNDYDVYQTVEPVKVDDSFRKTIGRLLEDEVMVVALGKDLVQLFVSLKEDEIRTIEECCRGTADGPDREAAMYEKGRELYVNLL